MGSWEFPHSSSRPQDHRKKQGVAFAKKLIGAGVGAIEAKGAAKAIEANKGAAKALQREIADGKNDLQREIAAVKSDLKLLKILLRADRACSTDQNRILLIARGALTCRDATAIRARGCPQEATHAAVAPNSGHPPPGPRAMGPAQCHRAGFFHKIL